jgi:hypothetical protein
MDNLGAIGGQISGILDAVSVAYDREAAFA